MKGKTIAGFALLLGIVMVGAFISGCIDQGTVTRTVSSPETSTTTQSPAPGNELESKEKELRALIDEYDVAIKDAKEKLARLPHDEILTGDSLIEWDRTSTELLRRVKSEENPEVRVLMLYDLAKLRYYELANLRALAGIGAIEGEYWENATTGEPIEAFYSMRGTFFYVSGRGIEELNRAGIVERMKKVQGYGMESLEIYHLGTGSSLRAIREGGRTVGAGQIVSIIAGTKNGVKIRAVNATGGELRLIDPGNGKTVVRISPDEDGVYFVPPVNTTLIGEVDDNGEWCYEPLPLDTHTLTPMPEEPDELVVCPAPQVAPFIFEPTDDNITQTPIEGLYLLPGRYTVTTLVMKADLKELAEQLVNINMRVGNGVITVETPTKALDAFQDAITNTYSAEMRTQEKCSCTVSPLIDGVFRRTFGGPFNEVPEPKAINITDFGNGPYIPVAWEKLENQSPAVVVYAITDSNGNTLIAIGDPGAKQGTKKPSSNRIAIGDPGVKQGTKKPSANRLASNYWTLKDLNLLLLSTTILTERLLYSRVNYSMH